MTREEAIRLIQDHMDVHHIGVYPHIRLAEALDMAISALRQQECVGEANKALTLDELLQIKVEPVWVVWKDGRILPRWFIVGSALWTDMFVEWDGTFSKDYGKTWLAYRQKPKEDQHDSD